MNKEAIKIIKVLGDTAAVARLFGVRMASVSNWKKTGIPSARMMYLRAAQAQALVGIDVVAATAQTRGNAQQPSSTPPTAQNIGAIDLDAAGLVDRRETVRRTDDATKEADLKATGLPPAVE